MSLKCRFSAANPPQILRHLCGTLATLMRHFCDTFATLTFTLTATYSSNRQLFTNISLSTHISLPRMPCARRAHNPPEPRPSAASPIHSPSPVHNQEPLPPSLTTHHSPFNTPSTTQPHPNLPFSNEKTGQTVALTYRGNFQKLPG